MIAIKEYNFTKSLEIFFRDKNIFLEEQKGLTYLNCNNTKLTSLKGIENCINLKSLYCYKNQLISLKGIENCINLEYLDCDDLDINQYKDKLKDITIIL
jgi:Leucine-rich repeat (LRR) protein